VAIALVVERGEWGKSTAIIARDLLAAYFGVPESYSASVPESYPQIGDDVDLFIPSPTPTPVEVADDDQDE